MDEQTPRWFKSSYSDAFAHCVEVALSDTRWFKSSHGDAANGGCVEVAFSNHAVMLVRDTRNRAGAVFGVGVSEWVRFVRLISVEA